MNIHLRFSVTADDYVEFHREMERLAKMTATGREPPKPAFTKLTWVLVATLGAILYLGLGATAAMQGLDTGAFSVRTIVSILCGGGLIALYVMRRRFWEWIIRQAAKRDLSLAVKQEVTLRDTGIETRSETMTTNQAWNHFTGFAETQGLFLLMVTNNSGQLLPKRAFESPEEMEEFRGFALARVGREVIGFPVVQS